MTNNANGDAGPLDRLRSEATGLVGALGDRAVSSLRDSVEGATERLTDYTKSAATPALKTAASGVKSLAEGKSPAGALMSAGKEATKDKVGGVVGKLFGKKGGGGKKQKITNIVESIDVGVPIRLAYDQWTRFTDFPSFMKKVENVEQPEDQKLTWKANVLWSHRTWESTIQEQTPDDKIVWRSKGAKGYVDGAVTFHELAPNLTRILVVLEYHPQGFFEHTGNMWRAQGRRVRLELKHFRRYVMTESVLHSEDVEGWRGVISDGEVKQSGGSRKKADKGQSAKRGRRARSDKSEETARPSSAGSNRRQSAGSRTREGAARQSSTRNSSTRQSGTRQSSTRNSSTRQSSTRQSSSNGGTPKSPRAQRTSASSGRGSAREAAS